MDLVNIRRVSTVFQKEIISSGRRIFCADQNRADEFEMVALSLYQKLNEERGSILEEALQSGRLLDVCNDIVWNKKESIERCIRQIRAYYALPGAVPFAENHLIQDAIAINMQRACEQAIDLANHTIKSRKLGLPKESLESFRLLADHQIIPRDLAVKLGKMVGFRNILVHEYPGLDIQLMVDVIENHLNDLIDFTNLILKEFGSE